MEDVTFKQRFGIEISKVLEREFPENTLIGLAHILVDLDSRSYLCGREAVLRELYRRARFAKQPVVDYQQSMFYVVHESLKAMPWDAVYDFCERVYEILLRPAWQQSDENEPAEEISLTDVRSYFSKELNLLLAEENIGYQFVGGRFQRRGRAQTQKNIQRMGSVLINPELADVRRHFNKARYFFDQKPEPDSPNCIKEALCAIEACLSHYYREDFSGDFNRALKRHQGSDPTQIPGPIAEGILKLYAYRGSGQGVAHQASQGSRTTELEAELVLNLVASFITYIVDIFFVEGQDIPF